MNKIANNWLLCTMYIVHSLGYSPFRFQLIYNLLPLAVTSMACHKLFFAALSFSFLFFYEFS